MSAIIFYLALAVATHTAQKPSFERTATATAKPDYEKPAGRTGWYMHD